MLGMDSYGTLRSLLSPIIAVGVKAKDRKWDRGNQNQNWVKTSKPTTDGMCVWPVLDCSEMVTLRPPGKQKAESEKIVEIKKNPKFHCEEDITCV